MFVHLRVHSEFSLLDGLVRIKELASGAAADAMPAVALSDHFNLYALVKFVRAAQSAGVKPICACDVLVVDDDKAEQDPESACLLSLYVIDAIGYKNLTELISKAHLEGQHRGTITVTKTWVAEYAEGLIALSGGREGEIGKALITANTVQAGELLQHWMSVFDDRFYIELQRTGRENEDNYLHAAVALADEFDCPVVATNDVRFMKSSLYEAHEARVCIHQGRTLDDPRRSRNFSDQQYFRSTEEMQALFSDLPDAIENTVAIAKRCNLDLKLGDYYLPDYPIPEGITMDDFFRAESLRGLEMRLDHLSKLNPEKIASRRQEYYDRLDFELGIIIQMGFPGYFLIVMDFIRWAKTQGIPVGPGRGSGAGSIVAYALEITDLDPLEYDLLFERFLNPERVSMPDFDVDFCMEGRDTVIAYVADTYGRDAVSQIITFGTMAAKAVVRDVARVQGKPYGLADKLSKLIPFEVGMTLHAAMEQEPALKEFVDENDEVSEIMDMAYQLEGITRNVGKHAGGVVIAPTTLTDFSPLYCDEAGNSLVTQFDKDDVESVGLVKFDFLGLRTLTIIDWALKLIAKRANPPEVDITAIPLGDEASFKLLQASQTTAVFQLESRGMKDLIKRLLPSNFEDIIALVALFRPGPLQSGMVDDFINRKHGRAKVVYDHESLKPVLENTYGVILYQEQVMQIAQVMANYSLGEADMLRRAMGKKKPEEMAKQKEFFCKGSVENNIDEKLATHVFDLMEKFAGYGFNKSHSAAYALVSYQTMWLKTHYPSEFMAAVLSADMQNTDKVVLLIEECRSMEIELVMPDVNRAEFSFAVDAQLQIIYGLGAIKGLGEGPVSGILDARADGGLFTDLFDFCKRTDSKKVNRRAIEALIRAGAFDRLGTDRSVLMVALVDAIKAADQTTKNASAGINDMFGDVQISEEDVYDSYTHIKPWNKKELLFGEKETLGLYLSGHPIDEYQTEIKRYNAVRIADIRPDKKTQSVVGLLLAVRTMRSKKGDTIAFITLDDKSARIEIAVFADMYNDVRDKLVKDSLICVEGVVSVDDFSGSNKMRTKGISTLLEARQHYASAVRLDLNAEQMTDKTINELHQALLASGKGSLPVAIHYKSPQATARLQLGDQWVVEPSDEFIQRLRNRYGSENVQLEFG